jgi:hypothetical protein
MGDRSRATEAGRPKLGHRSWATEAGRPKLGKRGSTAQPMSPRASDRPGLNFANEARGARESKPKRQADPAAGILLISDNEIVCVRSRGSRAPRHRRLRFLSASVLVTSSPRHVYLPTVWLIAAHSRFAMHGYFRIIAPGAQPLTLSLSLSLSLSPRSITHHPHRMLEFRLSAHFLGGATPPRIRCQVLSYHRSSPMIIRSFKNLHY